MNKKYLPIIAAIAAATAFWYYKKKSFENTQGLQPTEQDVLDYFVAEQDPLTTEESWAKFQHTVA